MIVKTKFVCYKLSLKPESDTQGGGFVLTLKIPESEWKAIKDLNDPILKQYEFIVEMSGKEIS